MSRRRAVRRSLRRPRRGLEPASTVVPRVSTEPSRGLETFPNPSPGRDYEVVFDCPEFTCLCPLTGQPDFAHMKITYVPDKRCVELKSLKLYLWSFREAGAFHEAVTNQVLDDLVEATRPRRMTVVGEFFVRGGIRTTVRATYEGGGEGA